MDATKTVNSSVFTGETGRKRGWSRSTLANIGNFAALMVSSATRRNSVCGMAGSGFIYGSSLLQKAIHGHAVPASAKMSFWDWSQRVVHPKPIRRELHHHLG